MDYGVSFPNVNSLGSVVADPFVVSKNLVGKKVLLIDDDVDLLQITSRIFKKAGAQVIIARDGSEGLAKLLTHRPHLILLDVMMPGANGFEICEKIRQISNSPLIMLTALDHDESILQGLESGADDFLSKPFKAEILLARARALLRRIENGGVHANNLNYNDGRLEIDTERHQVQINGKKVKLTPIEFRLLVYLEQHAGRALTYNQILDNVWGEEYRGNVDFVHVYVSHLRSKIEEDPKKPRYIMSVHGIGYIFERRDLLPAG